MIQVGHFDGGHDLFTGWSAGSIGDVEADGVVEEDGFLGHDAHEGTELAFSEMFNIDAVD